MNSHLELAVALEAHYVWTEIMSKHGPKNYPKFNLEVAENFRRSFVNNESASRILDNCCKYYVSIYEKTQKGKNVT